MSSAILYLAIVAIWACVLIPRWLRRDPARTVPAPAPAPAAAEPSDEGDDGPLEHTDTVPGPGRAVEPLSPEESRRRMLAARRRLLLMLIGLEIAAIALAVLALAAVWVVVPPSIMLVGYLLLLREAGRVDAERAQHEAEAAAVARARQRTRGQMTHASHATHPEGTSAQGIPESAALAAKFAAAPVPADYEDYEDYGRDFAPGLAGKYTTSNADTGPREPADEDDDESPEDPPQLRAIGE